MTSKLDNSARSSGDRARAVAYVRDFLPGVIGYVAVLLVVLVWGGLDSASPWRFLWALLPLVPILWMVRAVVRHLRRVDEYQRMVLWQSLSAGFSVAMLAALTLGFLGLAGLELPVPLATGSWIVFAVGMLSWCVAAAALAQRARSR